MQQPNTPYRRWQELGHWEVSLSAIFLGHYGRKSGSYIYIVRYSGVSVYVGMTRGSIVARLTRHIADKSNLGAAMQSDACREYLGWAVHVIKVDGELETAERHYIRKLRPPMNIEENNNSQEHVTKTVRIFDQAFRPNAMPRHRKRKRP